MPSTPGNEAYNYAERLRARLPRRLQEIREAAGVSRYGLEKRAAVSRDTIGDFESGRHLPGFHVAARLAYGLNLTLWQLVKLLEE